MTVSIVDEQGTHLLIASDGRYAVVERRAGQIYNCHDASRAGLPVSELEAVGRILDDSDWVSKEAAEKDFAAIVARGTDLAQRL